MENGIKDWIREETGKPGLSDASILISKTPAGTIRIVLLDGICCRPSIEFSKPLQEISREDIQQQRHKLLHHHA
jgi:hypothetical protein